MSFKIELGTKVRDRLTGFTGIVAGRYEYLYGLPRYGVAPLEAKDGKAEWGNFDEDALEVLDISGALKPGKLIELQLVPIVGATVTYRLDADDAAVLNADRADGEPMNSHEVGQLLPAMIVKTWGNTPDSVCNLQVFADGVGSLWKTSRHHGYGDGQWKWAHEATEA